jgi:lipopolysaccharide biosynthesis glycosyltransferase
MSAQSFNKIINDPKNKYVIVVVATEQYIDLLEYTLPAMARYATKCKANLILITNNVSPKHPLANKFQVSQVVGYKRYLYLDADVWINDNCPNLFKMYRSGTWMHLDDPYLKDRTEFEAASKFYKLNKPCHNSGVVIYSDPNIWLPPEKLYPNHYGEQTWVSRGKVNNLPSTFNWQPWFTSFAEQMNDAYIIHLSNTTIPARLLWLKERSEKRLVITVVSGKHHKKQYDITSPMMKAYAKKHKADFIMLPGTEGITDKLLIQKYIKLYDKTLLLDTDVIVTDLARDLFQYNDVAAHDEYLTTTKNCPIDTWWKTTGEAIAAKENLPTKEQMINSGVVLFTKQKANAYLPTQEPLDFWWYDQQLLTMKLDSFINLPSACNHTYLNRAFWRDLDRAEFIHLAACPNDENKLNLLSRLKAKNYTKPEKLTWSPVWFEPRKKLNQAVVMYTDEKFFFGAYITIWSLLRVNDAEIHLCLNKSGTYPEELTKELESWGVNIIKHKLKYVGTDWDATWNKPFIIQQIVNEKDTIWLDSDLFICKDVSSISNHSTFVTDHGYPVYQNNGPAIDSMFGPKQQHNQVQAGVLGFQGIEGRELVDQWCDSCLRYLKQPVPGLQYHDQGILNQIYRGPIQDGHTYNRSKCPRPTHPTQLHHLVDSGATICHFTGPNKPWLNWKPLSWGRPW